MSHKIFTGKSEFEKIIIARTDASIKNSVIVSNRIMQYNARTIKNLRVTIPGGEEGREERRRSCANGWIGRLKKFGTKKGEGNGWDKKEEE